MLQRPNRVVSHEVLSYQFAGLSCCMMQQVNPLVPSGPTTWKGRPVLEDLDTLWTGQYHSHRSAEITGLDRSLYDFIAVKCGFGCSQHQCSRNDNLQTPSQNELAGLVGHARPAELVIAAHASMDRIIRSGRDCQEPYTAHSIGGFVSGLPQDANLWAAEGQRADSQFSTTCMSAP